MPRLWSRLSALLRCLLLWLTAPIPFDAPVTITVPLLKCGPAFFLGGLASRFRIFFMSSVTGLARRSAQREQEWQSDRTFAIVKFTRATVIRIPNFAVL